MIDDMDRISETTPLSLEIERILSVSDPDGLRRASCLSEAALRRAWNEISGTEVAKVTTALHLRNHELVVTVNSPLWAQELSFLADCYCEKLAEALESGTIRRISFRVA